MTHFPFVRLLASIALIWSAGTGSGSSVAFDPAPSAPVSGANLAHTAAGEWEIIERRVLSGIKRGVRGFRFGEADRDDVVAIAMERAWRSFAASEEPINNPEAWGARIAERVSLDELRRQARDRIRNAVPIDADVSAPSHWSSVSIPFDEARVAEVRRLVHERVSSWPDAERGLAERLLDGRADTITAAAWLYREDEEASGADGTMYPLRARTLLEALRRDLQDLV